MKIKLNDGRLKCLTVKKFGLNSHRLLCVKEVLANFHSVITLLKWKSHSLQKLSLKNNLSNNFLLRLHTLSWIHISCVYNKSCTCMSSLSTNEKCPEILFTPAEIVILKKKYSITNSKLKRVIMWRERERRKDIYIYINMRFW